MNKNLDIKLMLYGIALIGYSLFAKAIPNNGYLNTGDTILVTMGVFAPFIGLILCTVGLFMKSKNKNDDSIDD